MELRVLRYFLTVAREGNITKVAFKYRIYSNQVQSIMLNKSFNCNRFIFNYFLNHKSEQYKETKKSVSYNECSKLLTNLKSNLEWLKEIDSISLQQTLRNLDRAFKDFFRVMDFLGLKVNIIIFTVICLENLKVKSMLKNSTLSKSISDVSWSKFRQLLEYKAKWYGRIVSIIDTYYPSSQLCSNCGFKNEEVKNLNIRAWECPNCKTKHHRDINSAIDIKRVGLVQSDFKPVEIVGYEVFETGSSYF